MQQELAVTKKELVQVEKELDHEKLRLHLRELMQAGQVVEEAGILDSYNPDRLYFLLKENREYLTKNSPASRYGDFDLMKRPKGDTL